MVLTSAIWLTGLPACGKTTIAKALVQALRARDEAVLWLDSDALREVMTPNPTYTEVERDVFYNTIAYLAARAVEGGAFAVISATAPRRAYRDAARAALGARFLEVFVDADEATRRARDFKGLYKASDKGQIKRLPGQGTSYEPPLAPELRLDSAAQSPAQAVDAVLARLAR